MFVNHNFPKKKILMSFNLQVFKYSFNIKKVYLLIINWNIFHDVFERVVQQCNRNMTKHNVIKNIFCKKDVLKNFAKFTGKYLFQSLFFNKVSGLSLAILIKKRLWHRYVPVNFAKFLRTSFFKEHIWWLLLYDIMFRDHNQ